MAEYPEHLVRAHRLLDGRTVMVRPIRPEDFAPVREFLNELSGESKYMRFQKWVHAPSDQLIHFLTDVDYDRHMALVCTIRHGDRDEIVGEARYVADSLGQTCELGIAIADAWHKSGVAGILMEALIHSARERGLARMDGLVLSTNAEMLRFVRALGFETEPTPEDRTLVRISKILQGPTESTLSAA
jgi:RimJ/RimL family protein N-acetyltransferase